MRRILLLVAGLLIVLGIAVPSAAFYYLTYTEGGFRFIIAHVPHSVGGVLIDISGPSGTIAHGIRIERLEIDHHLVHLHFGAIQGRIELLPLFFQTIRSRNASIDSLVIQSKRRTRPPTSAPPMFVPRWLIVSADQLHLASLRILSPSGASLDATQLYASGSVRHSTIKLFEVNARFDSFRVQGDGVIRAHDPLRMDVKTRISWSASEQPAWSVDAQAKGNLNALAITGQTITPFRSDFSGWALDLTGQWRWTARAAVHDLDVRAWGGSGVLGLLSGKLVGQGNQNGFTAHGPIDSSGLKVGIFDAQFEGAYANRILWAKRIDLQHRASAAHVIGGGSIGVVPNGPKLNLHGNWSDFRWPLVGKTVPFKSASGEFTVDGTWPYSVHASGMAAVRDFPSMPATVDGLLAKERFTFTSAAVDLYDGRANLSGEVAWGPTESWSVSGHVSEVNPGYWRPDSPGKLTFNISTAGRGFSGDGDFMVDVRDISGRVRGVPAAGAGKLARTAGTWAFDDIHVVLGGTRLVLDGTVNGSVDLRFALNSHDLSLLSADSRGQLESAGTIRGTPEQPTILASAHGKDISHEGLVIEDLDANINFDPSPLFESRVDLHVRNLSYQQRTLEDLSFKLAGRSSDYVAKLEGKALGLQTALRAHGPFVNGEWHGELDALNVSGTQSLQLELERPVDLFVSAGAFKVDWLCLNGQPASLCTDADWRTAQWHTTFTANELPLATLTAGMTQAVEYGGRINIHGHLYGGAQELSQGTVRALLTGAQLTHRLASGRKEQTQIGSGLVAVSATSANITGEVGLESGDVGTIKGKLEAQRGASDWKKLPVRGELHAHTDQLGLITLYIPDIDRAAGHLDADMQIAGNLGTPLVNGSMKITEGEIDYYQVNLGMRQVAFDAVLNENGVDFSGFTRIGSGTANAKGRLQWHNSLPYGKVQVEGSNLRVVDVPEAQIEASPNLEFNINGRRIESSGTVKIPYAKIAPADLTGAVRASSDEVIVGQEPQDPAKRFEVLSTIALSLGDHVSVDTTGLSGRLTGNITVRSGYEAITSATGELSIEQGKYTAYARKLDIRRGRLIFTGGPVDNPGIDIRAVKEYPDVTAGVNVRGTLLQPRLSFFSDPSLTQSQIVSLILAGGSLESAQNRQAGAGYEALAQGGAILAQQLGSRVGIEDVSLESDLTNETSLVLGRYLSPRLYVSYGVALTEQLNVLKLRYSVSDRWTIKTEVGQARGADLVYTIQR